MFVILLVVLMILVAVLSKPGRISRIPPSGSALSLGESLLVQRGLAFLLMLSVIIPAFMHTQVWMAAETPAILAIGIIVVLVPLLAWPIARADKPAQEQGIGSLAASRSGIAAYTVVTILYMAGYEIILRGVFLTYLLTQMNTTYAVLVNAVVYAAMHLFKSLREAFLSLPLGVFLCWLTLYTGSVWPAVTFHVAMALSFEFYYTYRSRNVIE